MGDPADKPPVLVPFDLEQIDGVLLASARALAYDINTDIVWKSDDDSGFEWLAGPLQKAYARVRYGTYGWEGRGRCRCRPNMPRSSPTPRVSTACSGRISCASPRPARARAWPI